MGCSVVMIKPQPHTLGLFHAQEKVSIAPVGALHLLRVKVDTIRLQPLRIKVSSVQQVGQISG